MTLHCYRYAWAERAKTAGYPERFAQEALGHNSKAVHRAYAKRALVKIPSLEEYEKNRAQENIIPLDLQTARANPGETGRPKRLAFPLTGQRRNLRCRVLRWGGLRRLPDSSFFSSRY